MDNVAPNLTALVGENVGVFVLLKGWRQIDLSCWKFVKFS
jgi:hypothetical protein